MSAEKTKFEPCSNCGSTEYDFAEYEDKPAPKNGLIILTPITCDVCTYKLTNSDSILMH